MATHLASYIIASKPREVSLAARLIAQLCEYNSFRDDFIQMYTYIYLYIHICMYINICIHIFVYS